jgi:uncharacterized protein (DUF433 family)
MNPARIPRMFRDNRKLLHPGGGVQDLGRTMVSDPHVCGGLPVFKGTRITVWDVMAQVVALECPLDAIIQATSGAVTREAIEEAKQLMRRSPETPDEDLLVCASSEFYEGPDHFTNRRASAHVPAPIDRSWLKRLLQLEAPKQGAGRLLAIDPDIDPYMPVIRGTRISLEDVVDWLIHPEKKESIPRHWAGPITRETIAEILKMERTLLHVEIALERPSFDKFLEETDRQLNQMEEFIRQARMPPAESADAQIAETRRAWRSPRKRH